MFSTGRWAARVFDLATPYGELRVRIFGLIEVANTQIRDQSRRWCNGILLFAGYGDYCCL
jgi:hypothetical protein